ncbi:hypothetical protein AYL99_01779 [Fonsecaea erecta]|uniref:O-acetylhomoserine (Thiol)-lyase n=1 Tax=Fonsecaea erecta TaxID=1367422 RepID=A0A178ZSB5_9EURO|nr:hypothetical protein AYL99_01779 [Fonsecaea erecta]OAP62552.1 hypothetical protein AYL99_01779 [Fonsecaea erecta]
MSPSAVHDEFNGAADGHVVPVKTPARAAGDWHFDTVQVHSGLEDETAHGQCTLPVYSSASFRFKSSKSISSAYSFEDGPKSQFYMYSRLSNPTTTGFERRMAALELGSEALSFSSGAAAVLTVAQSLFVTGDNAVVSCSVHGGTFHQFKVILPALGLEGRIVDTNDIAKVESLVDERTKFIFTETIGNPKCAVADLEKLSAIARRVQIPLIVDATFTAAGYFCQPASFGADIVIHSATKWIGGHGTTLGGVVIDTGRPTWQSNAARFPHLHARRGRNGSEPSLFEQFKGGAYMTFLRWDYMRDTGACLGAQAAQQLFIGVETLSLRCERQCENAETIAAWLRNHSRVAWVRYLGFEDHEYHQMAKKYLRNGFGTVLTFGLKGSLDLAWQVIDALRLILNTPNVGDAKTTVGHHWSTTHKTCSEEENEDMGVYQDLFRLSLGIENVQDLIADFQQAFDAVPLSG